MSSATLTDPCENVFSPCLASECKCSFHDGCICDNTWFTALPAFLDPYLLFPSSYPWLLMNSEMDQHSYAFQNPSIIAHNQMETEMFKEVDSTNKSRKRFLGNNNEAQQFLSKGGQVIVRMRGLPYDCTAQQVIDFFANGENNCDVMHGEEGVLFVRKTDGRATGDAFVLFATEDMAIRALQKHREVIGARYIELFRSSTAEVQQVLNRTMDSRMYEQPQPLLPPVPLIPQQLLPSGSRKDCIRLRGLPYEAQVEQILEFLCEHAKNIVFQGVHMVYNAQGQPSGEAFIQMDSEQSAALAANQRHHKFMVFGKKQRYIEVFQCSIDDMNLVLTGGVPVQRPLLSSGGNLLLPPYGPYPCMQNPQVLPTAAVTTAASAAALNPGAARVPPSFYHPIIYWPYPSPPVSPTTYFTHSGPTMLPTDCIQLQRGNDGRSNGDGVVTFPARVEAERAIQEKNRQNIGNRYIELFMA